MALKTSSDTAHWSEVAWMFSFFAKFFFSTMDFYGALSPGVIYIGYKLIRIIPISLTSKYYYVKIMVISFRMMYHYTWNSKTNLNIVSSLDLNIISNKNDNHKHKHSHDMIICIWIWFTMYGSSILFLSGVWWVYQKFHFLPLSHPGWRGIVVMVRVVRRSGGRLPNLRNPYLCNHLRDFLHSNFCGIV